MNFCFRKHDYLKLTTLANHLSISIEQLIKDLSQERTFTNPYENSANQDHYHDHQSIEIEFDKVEFMTFIENADYKGLSLEQYINECADILLAGFE